MDAKFEYKSHIIIIIIKFSYTTSPLSVYCV